MEKCAAMVAELKASLPIAIQEARYVLAKKDETLAAAQKEAEQILTDTKRQVEHMVLNSEIVKKCEKYALKISEENLGKADTVCGKCIYACPHTQKYIKKL